MTLTLEPPASVAPEVGLNPLALLSLEGLSLDVLPLDVPPVTVPLPSADESGNGQSECPKGGNHNWGTNKKGETVCSKCGSTM